MSFRIKSLALPAFAVIALSIPALAQTTGVEGIVTGPDGKPLQGAIVKFERSDIKGHYEVKTDKKGHYGHYGLPLGTFNVDVYVGSEMKDEMKGVKTHGGDPQQLNFDLARAAAAAGAAAANAPEADRSMSKADKEKFEKQKAEREAALAKNKALNDAYNLGKQALEAKAWDQAVDALVKATELDAKQSAVWSSLAEAYSGLAASKPADSAANYQKAYDAYAKAIELAPTDAGLYNNYALALARGKKIDDAKTNLAKAAELDPPGAGKYYYNLGALLVNSGQNDAATDQFKKAIDADPTYADAQYQYGLTLAGKSTTDASGKIVAPPGAVEALQKYLSLKPDGPYAASAKEMIAQLGSTVQTSFTDPNAKKDAPKKKK
jgi:tetratricopeptide (TPR) repeat protein